MTLQYDLGKASEIGDRRKNQDRCGVAERPGAVLLVLADGMGGHPRGELAAETIVNTCMQLFREAAGPIKDPVALLHKLLRKAHREVIAFGRRRRPPIEPRSTAILALVNGGRLHWAHLGDSRLYLFRKGELIAQTVDHSYVEKLRQQGIISDEEIDGHPFRNYVTRCVGGAADPPIASTGGPVDLEPGDVIVLCSDGLWAQMGPGAIGRALERPGGLGSIVSGLVRTAAQTAAPGSDNVSALALRWLGEARPKPSTEAGNDLTRAIADIKHALAQFEAEQQQEKR